MEGLTPEELRELEELEAMEANGDFAEISFEEGEGAAPIDEESVQSPLTQDQEAAQGFMANVPFGEEATAAVVTAHEGMQRLMDQGVSDAVQNISGDYNRNLDQVHKEIEKTAQRGGMAFDTGSTVGTFAPALIPGTATLKGSTMLGGVLGFDEERDVEGVLVGMSTGALFHYGGEVAGKTIKGIGNKLNDLSKKYVPSAMGAIDKWSKKMLKQHLNISGQSADDFANSMRNLSFKKVNADGKTINVPVINSGQSFDDTLTNLNIKKKQTGQELGNVFNKLEDQFGSKAEVNSQYIKKQIEIDVLDPLENSQIPEHRKLYVKMKEYMEETLTPRDIELKKVSQFGEATEKIANNRPGGRFKLSEVHQIRSDLNKIIENVYKKVGSSAKDHEAAEIKRRMGSKMKEILDSQINKLDPEALKGLNKLRSDYGNIATAESLLTRITANTGDVPFQNLKNTFSNTNLIRSAAGKHAFGMSQAPAFIASTAIQKLATSSNAPATMTVGLNRLANYINKNPDSPIIKKLIASSHLPMDEFRNSVASSVAEIGFRDRPLARRSDDILARKYELLSIMDEKNPELASEFRSLLEAEDFEGLNQVVDMFANHKSVKHLVDQNSRGIDGKVYSQQDKTYFDNAIRESQLTTIEQMEALDQLHMNGTIPNLKSQKVEPSFRYNPDKNRFNKDY